MYYDLHVFDHDTLTSRIHFVNFAAFTLLMTLNLAYRSSEVVDFHTNRKRVWDFLLDLTNLGRILPRFRDIGAFVRQKPLFRYPSLFWPKFQGVPLGVDP